MVVYNNKKILTI